MQILCVEDDETIRELLVDALESEGHVPVGVSSAEEGLERLKEEPFDVVLTDYQLPEHSGSWLVREARRLGYLPSDRAVMLTAHPSPERVDGIDVVQKPFELDALLDHIERLGREAADCELVLFVRPGDRASDVTRRAVQDVVGRQPAGKFSLDVREVPRGGANAGGFTPTLVRRRPGPRLAIRCAFTDPAEAERCFVKQGLLEPH